MGEYTEEDSRGSMPDQSFDGVESGAGGGETSRDPGEMAGGLGCMAITRMSLRGAECVLSLICFSLVAASQGPSGGYALNVSSVAFLLAMGVLTFCYSAAAAVLLTLALLRPSSDLTYRLPRPLLISDFVFLLLLFAASCAAAADASGICAAYSKLISSPCSLISGGAAMGFLASFLLMADFWLTLVPVFVEI